MSDIDQQFIEYVVKSLVGNPDAVHIDRRIDEKGVLLELTVDPEDLGRVIGKRGATAQSLRTLLRALGTKNDARYNLKIIDNGPLDHGRPSDDSAEPPQAKDEPSSDNAGPANDDAGGDTAESSEETAQPQSEETAAPEATEEPAEPTGPAEPQTEPEGSPAEAPKEEQTSDRLQRTREELADLDDLDV